jgi:hypothetical protein
MVEEVFRIAYNFSVSQSIKNDFLKGFGELGEEIGEKTIKETGKIFEPIISTRELLGFIQPMSDEELKKKKEEDEKTKEDEIAKLKAAMGSGRNLEEEIKRIREEEDAKEKQEEQEFLENLKIKKEMEAQEEAEAMAMMTESSNPAKQKKSRGSAMAKGKNGKASTSDMSATAEFFKKPD